MSELVKRVGVVCDGCGKEEITNELPTGWCCFVHGELKFDFCSIECYFKRMGINDCEEVDGDLDMSFSMFRRIVRYVMSLRKEVFNLQNRKSEFEEGMDAYFNN